jgi:hypothetical protein
MIGWVSHHRFELGLSGGAEMSDQRIAEQAPIEIDRILPTNWSDALKYDRILITGTDLLSNRAMMELAKKKPVVMLHHKQTQHPARQHLLNSARVMICRTPRHLEIEKAWTQPKNSTWILSSIETSLMQVKEKENFALWASRNHPQKGMKEAIKWSSDEGIPLQMYWDKPYETVLETMSRAKHFVFLPTDFDAEPRVLIEALLSGCQVHTNANAGLTSVPDWDKPDHLKDLVDGAAKKFWDVVIGD